MFKISDELVVKLNSICEQYNFSSDVKNSLNELLQEAYEYGIGVGQEDILKEWESMF